MNVQMKKPFAIFGVLVCLSLPHLHALPQADSLAPSLLDTLLQFDRVDAKLFLPFDSLEVLRLTDRACKGKLELHMRKGGKMEFEVRLKGRGRFRRRVCVMPPLEVDFSKKDLEGAGLAAFDKYKLVYGCLEDRLAADRLVLREYVAYKLYNMLTPYSFRVQLLRLTVQDAADRKNKSKQWAFLIESDDELAQRLHVVECKQCMGVPSEKIEPVHEKIMSLFQFMICNTDWNISMNRNVKLFERKDGLMVPIPYDFDFSALVGAPYARPNSDVGQKSVTHRVFMGQVRSLEALYSTMALFRTRRSDFVAFIMDFKPLPREERIELVQFLDSFYLSMADPENAQTNLFGKKALEKERENER